MIKSKSIALQASVVQKSGFLVSDMDGEKVMLSIQNGKYYNLGEIGGVIWERMQEPILVSNLTDDLQIDYEVDQKTCEEQVIKFLDMLLNEDLIHVVN